jgi:hypothetical protein
MDRLVFFNPGQTGLSGPNRRPSARLSERTGVARCHPLDAYFLPPFAVPPAFDAFIGFFEAI